MTTETISIQVDADTAKAFSQASQEDRRKMQLLLNLRLRELTAGPIRPLAAIMDEIGAHAAAQGLTPEFLESMLHGD
jgi:predicted amino acid racemase